MGRGSGGGGRGVKAGGGGGGKAAKAGGGGAPAPSGPPTDRAVQAEFLRAMRAEFRMPATVPPAFSGPTMADRVPARRETGMREIPAIRDRVERRLGPVPDAQFNRAVFALRRAGRLEVVGGGIPGQFPAHQRARGVHTATDNFMYVERRRGRG